MVFGSISPAKKTTTLVTSLPAVTAHMPLRRWTSTLTTGGIGSCIMIVAISSLVIV